MEDIDFSLNDSDLAMESPDPEMEDTDFDLQGSDLEADDDFSFEETEFELDEDGESGDLEFEDDESPELELEEGRLDFEDAPEEDFDGIDFDGIEFDGIEFETVEDEPASLDLEAGEPVLKMKNETDELTLDEADFELEFDVEDDSKNGIPSILDDDETDRITLEIETEPDQTGPDQIEPDQEDSILSLEETDAEEEEDLHPVTTLEENEEEEPPVITLEDDFSEYDDVLKQETEPEDDLLDKEAIEDEDTIRIDDTLEEKRVPVEEPEPIMDEPPKPERRKKSLGALVLVLVLIFLLVISANITGILTGYKIPYISDIKLPYIEQLLKKSAPEIPEAKPVPNQKSVNGRFVTNSTAGTLFVITGRVENPSTIALSHIEIIGALITKDKVEAKTKNTFCGNIITEEMLKTGNISDINRLLTAKEGKHNTNINVKPGASIPFMVVFSDLPEKLQNFTVKVTGFKK
jgi:hypothetical protein